jgi:hypothetical protein
MLNSLYHLLVRGHHVTILLIPYHEHDNRNRTLRTRLEEDVELTREFYRSYLGFDGSRLRILSTLEMDLTEPRLREIQQVYLRLYQDGARAVRTLIDEQNRVWASPNILFVPKCIAAIEAAGPDYVICGRKHLFIAEAFDEILRARGNSIPSFAFDNFKDLLMASPMDRTDSVHSYITINDNDDFVLHKLWLMRDQPEQKSDWLRHFVEEVFVPAPNRAKEGISPIQRSAAETELALTKFLANVRALIPYRLDDGTGEVGIVWAGDLDSDLDEAERGRIERAARRLYQDGEATNITSITMRRFFDHGRSGARVIEVREHEGADAQRISNVSVLKVGPELELRREERNYERYIRHRATAAFMAIKSGSVSADGMAAIAYQDAQHYLGLGLQDGIKDISSICPAQFDPQSVRNHLDRLLKRHLYSVLYKHGSNVEAGAIQRYLNEFLPAEYRVEVDVYDHAHEAIVTSRRTDPRRLLETEILISEVNARDRTARGHTPNSNSKIDIVLAGTDQPLLEAVNPGRRLRLDGYVLRTREDYFRTILSELKVPLKKDRIELSRRVSIENPIDRIRYFLERECYNFTVSAVHGDLHAGNVLFSEQGFGIIDYGKMRDPFPALYDVAFLLADLKSRFVANRYDVNAIDRMESEVAGGLRRRRWRPWGTSKRSLNQILLFEYARLPEEIKMLGKASMFYAILGLILLGRLKFDNLSEKEKRVGLILAHYAFLKAQCPD